MPSPTKQTIFLPKTEAARRAIAACVRVDEVKDIRDKAEAVRLYAKRRGLGQEMIDDATEIVLQAERRGGEMLAAMQKAKGGRPTKTGNQTEPVSASTLREAGVTKAQSSRWQALAKVPEREFAAAVVEARKENRLSSAAVREVIKRHSPAPERTPAPFALPEHVRVEVGDATRLADFIEAESVDLIVTSPPYGLDVPYTGQMDSSDGWQRFMLSWLMQARNVSTMNGRLALNVPLDTTRGGCRPTFAQAVHAAEEVGWVYRSSIVWNEGNLTHSTGRGSVESPSSPHIMAPVEMIAIFGAGADWKIGGASPDIAHDDWLAWTCGLWTFHGEGRAWEGHPAPFPEELPRRLIQLLSFPGATVLDPFCGSGTTPTVAARLGRKAIGIDLSPEYVESTKRRIAHAFSK